MSVHDRWYQTCGCREGTVALGSSSTTTLLMVSDPPATSVLHTTAGLVDCLRFNVLVLARVVGLLKQPADLAWDLAWENERQTIPTVCVAHRSPSDRRHSILNVWNVRKKNLASNGHTLRKIVPCLFVFRVQRTLQTRRKYIHI